MMIASLIEEIGKEVTEPRRVNSGNTQHKLENIIIIGLCTIICGSEDYTDIEASGRNGKNGSEGFWNCLMGSRTAMRSGGFLNGRSQRNWGGVCVNGWIWSAHNVE